MYHTLVTRDTTPQEGENQLRQPQMENHKSGALIGVKTAFQSANRRESPFEQAVKKQTFAAKCEKIE